MGLFRPEKNFVSLEVLGAEDKGRKWGDRIMYLMETFSKGLTLKCDSNKDRVCIIKDIKDQVCIIKDIKNWVCIIEPPNIKTTPLSLMLWGFLGCGWFYAKCSALTFSYLTKVSKDQNRSFKFSSTVESSHLCHHFYWHGPIVNNALSA